MSVNKNYLDKTWSDFSQRMKGSQVTQENWTAFYIKYEGFVYSYIHKHSYLNDTQIQAVMDMVVDDIFIKHKLNNFKTEEKRTFRSWFATLIRCRMIDYIRTLKNDTVSMDDELMDSIIDQNKEEESEQDNKLWRSYVAYLALDEVSQKSPPAQVQCFLWRVCHNKKPAEIAPVLNMDPEQVSEAVRSFKDKVTHAFKQMGETLDMETTDWKELKLSADAARDIYLHEADAFTERMMENEQRS